MSPPDTAAQLPAENAMRVDTPSAPSKVPDNVIIPPPEIRNIVDKTANFVARNGPQFEGKIREKEVNNPKFCFLNPSDPYHSYYQWKLVEFQEGRATLGAAPAGQDVAEQVPAQPAAPAEPEVPEQPPIFEFLLDVPPMAAQDLDVIKLTAQFVARNGRTFMTDLAQREARNPQFDFLKPSHPLFGFFTRLVEQYIKVLLPPPPLVAALREHARMPYPALQNMRKRATFARWEAAHLQKEKEDMEAERMAFAAIDWQDFVIVETLMFTDADVDADLPAPTSLLALQSEAVALKRKRLGLSAAAAPVPAYAPPAAATPVPTAAPAEEEEQDMDMGEEDMDMDMDMEEDDVAPAAIAAVKLAPTAPAVPAPAPTAVKPVTAVPVPVLGPMKIRDTVVPRKVATTAEPTSICERCGLAIPDSQMEEHMRIELLDPKWREQREAAAAARRETNLVMSGTQVVSTLQAFKEYRLGTDEADLQKKLEDDAERQRQLAKNRVIWDGHTASITTATAKIKEIAPIDEQIAAIHKSKGLIEMTDDEAQMYPRPRAPLPGSMPSSLSDAPRPPMAPVGVKVPPPPPRGMVAPPPPPRGTVPPPPPPGGKPVRPYPDDGNAERDAKRTRGS
ncbi:hypothetical protein AMAG_13426 [Allomyces macrogynus ATCC 38327]|uniref:SURP motif domain-containing protein n=1 Tax=Allomyces macrogynus (strain ATCC 38327) TaxID=578462 RepID=A0A0L0T298_ALLM3|nr:hypothetical protein AMAG_13426 [Allomyces macrogynus ATCC 38327]|eukprot:KNE68785.1 hypothetical protein AMAG_13426 [Allomyces macrogynus ATCC 38327]